MMYKNECSGIPECPWAEQDVQDSEAAIYEWMTSETDEAPKPGLYIPQSPVEECIKQFANGP